jgi:hypothetical protein
VTLTSAFRIPDRTAERGSATVRAEAEADAAAIELPADLRAQVEGLLDREPSIPWDLAVANLTAVEPTNEP